MKINNMAELKRALKVGVIIKTIDHQKAELIGMTRRVTKVQTNAVYTIIPNQPDHKYSKCNGGRGSRMDLDKATHYEFGDTVKWFNLPIGTERNRRLIMEFQIFEKEGTN